MASQGPNFGGTAANDASYGTVAWTAPNQALTADGNSSSVVSFNQTSQYIKVTNFGFSVPAGVTVDGIVVEVYRYDNSSGGSVDSRVRIVKGGTVGSTDKSKAAIWPGAIEIVTYGSSSDLWGETWSDSDINGSGFGFALSVTTNDAIDGVGVPAIDYVRITVYYTAAAGGVVIPRRPTRQRNTLLRM